MRNLPYDRAERVGEQIYQVVASYIYENIDDERLKGLQLTHVQLTKDFSLARIYFYMDGGAERQDNCLEALEEFKSELRKFVGSEVRLRLVPKLEFHLDEGARNAERIHEIFEDLERK